MRPAFCLQTPSVDSITPLHYRKMKEHDEMFEGEIGEFTRLGPFRRLPRLALSPIIDHFIGVNITPLSRGRRITAHTLVHDLLLNSS